MEKFRILKVIDWFIGLIVYSVIFLIPMVFSLFISTYNVFVLPKLVVLKIAVLLLVLLYGLRLIMEPPKSNNFLEKLKNFFSNNKLFIFTVILFLASILISTLLSIKPETSFYGTYDRREGLNIYIYYFLFIILLLFSLKQKEDLRKIIMAAVWSSIPVCVYGLYQVLGFEFLPWSELAADTKRITSTIGQPNHLAAYLLLIFPLTVYLWHGSKKTLIKLSYLILGMLQLLCLFFTYSISGWLGFMAGVILTGLLFAVIKRNKIISVKTNAGLHAAVVVNPGFKTRVNDNGSVQAGIRRYKHLKLFLFRKEAFFAVIAIIIFATAIIKLDTGWTWRYKLNSIMNMRGGSVSARLQFWDASIKAIKQKPILGYGLESQGDVLQRYYEADWGVYNDINVKPNRAHNLFLDIWLTRGLVGVISFLLFLYLLFAIIFKNIKQGNHAALNYAIFFGFSAYLTALMFGFTTLSDYFYFWLLFAIIISIKYNFKPGLLINRWQNSNQENNLYKNPGLEKRMLSFGIKATAAIVICVIPGLLIIGQIKEVEADNFYWELNQASYANEFYGTVGLYEEIEKLHIRDIEYTKAYSEIMAGWLKYFDRQGTVFRDTGEKILKNALADITGDSINDHMVRAKILGALAEKNREEYYARAEAEYLEAISRAPAIPSSYYFLARFYNNNGDHEKAIKNYNLAISMLPSLEHPDLNQKHGDAIKLALFLYHKDLGDAFGKLKEYGLAEENYRLALKYNEDDVFIYNDLSNLYFEQGRLDEAIAENLKGRELLPKSYLWPLNIAKLYKKKGDRELALKYAEEAQVILPNYYEIESLVEELSADSNN